MLQPLVNNAYTSKGNEYKKSNLGKYSAAATVGTGATIIAMKNIPFGNYKKPIENLKKVDFTKIKNIKNVKIQKPDFEKLFQNAISGVKNLGTKIKSAIENVKSFEYKKLFKKPEFITNLMSKVKKPELNKVKVLEMLKSSKAEKYAQYAGFVAGALVTGLAIDFVLNKINAYKADKK